MLEARSIAEAHLYLEIQVCRTCNLRWDGVRHALRTLEDRPVAVYSLSCSSCGARDQLEFLMPREPLPPGPLGGNEPSEIMDPGEFHAASDVYFALARDAVEQANPGDYEKVATLLRRSVYALAEVPKFIPPSEDRVPPELIVSEIGRASYERNPDRFVRDRIEYEIQDLLNLMQRYLPDAGPVH
ncbi:hypothetical protein ABZ249_17805 [Nocardiopsis sp. NPDC006139]|uniref:hypothetical protein n=1 Tax=unclassified Nocardiopsis TaxID=2649073 RepID=UPI0033AF9C30